MDTSTTATLHSNPAKPLTLSSTAATNSTSVPSVAHIQDRSSPVSSSSQPPADPSNNSNNVNNTSNSNANHGALNPDRKRRGNLPKSVTSVLKSWLVQNAIHPYPTEEEKMRLSEATQLSMNQISNWFINARRRILQPILVEAAAAAVAGTDAPMENVLIVRKGKGSRMQVEMEGVTSTPTSCPNLG
ncbi:hypothetical protein BGX28_006124 [Mortierella sp. GBA30]|nr:hypothetical protein BGX28_006124 [Mortierella sp. GBA30]